MAFSAYIVSASIQNTASNIQATEFGSSSGTESDGYGSGAGAATYSASYCPSQTSIGGSESNSYSETFPSPLSGSLSGVSHTYSEFIVSSKSHTFYASFETNSTIAQDTDNWANSFSGYTSSTLSASTESLSDFPFVTIKYSSGSTESVYASDGIATTSSSFSTSDSGTQDGAPFLPVIYAHSTFTYTATYTLERSTTIQQTSGVSFPSGTTVDIQSTTYSVATKTSGVSFPSGTTTETFTSTRLTDFTLFHAPDKVTMTFNLEYFRPVGAKSSNLTEQPLLRAFWSELTSISSYSGIDKYNAILNASDSTQFTIENFNIPTGYSVASQQNSTYTLTTNTWTASGLTTTLTSYNLSAFAHQGISYSFFANTSTIEHAYSSFFQTSGTSTRILLMHIGTLPTSEGYNAMAYSYFKTATLQTTSTYKDFVCNSITFLEYTASRLITSSSTFLTATNILVQSGSSRTEYIYDSFNFLTFASFAKTPNTFYSFSTQEILHGNFVKNLTDKTAYWGIATANFAGIIDFSCIARRDSNPVAVGVPKFFRFGNYSVVCPHDPLSTLLSSVTINQYVSSASAQTLITQTVNWTNSTNSSSPSSSTTRSFELSYENQTQTMPWTSDSVNDFDMTYSQAYLSPKPESQIAIRPNPVVAIRPECIFNTIGQMHSAVYSADGAYFKSESGSVDSVAFVSTTYSHPISIELGVNDNSLAGLNIVRTPVSSDASLIENFIVSFYMPMRAFFT